METITFYVQPGKSNITFLTAIPTGVDSFEINPYFTVGFIKLMKLSLADKLTTNTEIKIICNGQLISQGYVWQLINYLRTHKSILIGFNQNIFGLLIPISIFDSNKPCETNDIYPKFGNVITCMFKKKLVKIKMQIDN